MILNKVHFFSLWVFFVYGIWQRRWHLGAALYPFGSGAPLRNGSAAPRMLPVFHFFSKYDVHNHVCPHAEMETIQKEFLKQFHIVANQCYMITKVRPNSLPRDTEEDSGAWAGKNTSSNADSGASVSSANVLHMACSKRSHSSLHAPNWLSMPS